MKVNKELENKIKFFKTQKNCNKIGLPKLHTPILFKNEEKIIN